LYTSYQGWHGLPGTVPPLSPLDEKSLITPLLEGLSSLFRLNLDTLPNLSRDATIFLLVSAPPADDMAALFTGGSNAYRLANDAATLGNVAETITTGGWVISTDPVTAILPQVIGLCESMPENAPVIIYCLYNSSFCCAIAEGQLSAITKQKDDIYHVVGEIAVVHEVTLAAAITNLKRILLACGNWKVIIITHGSRYLTTPCCCSSEHCTHLLVPDSGLKLMCDLARLHQFILRRLGSGDNCSVIPACDLLTGRNNTSPEDALSAFSSWGTVHGSGAHYTRIALALVDNHFGSSPPSTPKATPQPATAGKRTWGESTSSSPYDSGSDTGRPIPALSSFRQTRFKAPVSRQRALPGFSRGGSRGGGNDAARGSKRSFRGGRYSNSPASPGFLRHDSTSRLL
jgi:hypothetical protein